MSVAGQIFAKKGYDGTSMREIAEACDISKALLYHHFKSKEEIYSRVVVDSGKRLYDYVDAQVAAQTSPTEKLRAFMVSSANYFEENRWGWIAAASAFWNETDSETRDERIARRDRYEHQLRDILQEAVDKGEIRPEVDVAMAGRLVLSSINWMYRWYKPEKQMKAGEIAEAYFEMIFEGLRLRD
nr:TetR/AcrR family transcriptional regulator [Oryzicola mucosus]